MEFEPSLLGWTLFETGEWEAAADVGVLVAHSADDVVIDIGANTGYYALLAAAKVGSHGHVHAFEIQPAMIEVLRRNIARNGLGEIVTVVEAGCFSKAGSAVIEPHGDPGSARIGFASAGIRIPLVTLDEYAETADLDRVDVLLIDTEGADFEILKGASRLLAAHHPSVITGPGAPRLAGGSPNAALNSLPLHTVIKPRRGLAQLDLAEVWEYRELLGLPGVARHRRPLQADHHRRPVGVHPAVSDDGHLHGRVRADREAAVEKACRTRCLQLHRAAAVAVLLDRVRGDGRVGGRERLHDHEDLLPAVDPAAGVDRGRDRRLPRLVRDPHSDHALVSHAGFRACVGAAALLRALRRLHDRPRHLFAALYVRYRDMRHLIPFLTQFGMYVSPVAYSTTSVSPKWRLLFSLNPMVAVIDGFRWSLLGTTPLYVPGIVAGNGDVDRAARGGVYYFKVTERIFADVM